jgi:hypothetical protein
LEIRPKFEVRSNVSNLTEKAELNLVTHISGHLYCRAKPPIYKVNYFVAEHPEMWTLEAQNRTDERPVSGRMPFY